MFSKSPWLRTTKFCYSLSTCSLWVCWAQLHGIFTPEHNVSAFSAFQERGNEHPRRKNGRCMRWGVSDMRPDTTKGLGKRHKESKAKTKRLEKIKGNFEKDRERPRKLKVDKTPQFSLNWKEILLRMRGDWSVWWLPLKWWHNLLSLLPPLLPYAQHPLTLLRSNSPLQS